MEPDRRRWALIGVVALVLVATVGMAAYLALPSEPAESRYGYTVSLSTTATLEDVTLILPIPTTTGDGVVVEAVSDGMATAPDGWNLSVVDTEYGPMLRIDLDRLAAERRPDGMNYSTYGIELSVPTSEAVDTRDPFDGEPLLTPRLEQRQRPCPNQAVTQPDETCYSFESRAFARYEGPASAEVDVYIVAGGMNDLTGAGRQINRYYDRVTVFLDGPQSGWIEAEGFTSTEIGTYSRFGLLAGLPTVF